MYDQRPRDVCYWDSQVATPHLGPQTYDTNIVTYRSTYVFHSKYPNSNNILFTEQHTKPFLVGSTQTKDLDPDCAPFYNPKPIKTNFVSI